MARKKETHENEIVFEDAMKKLESIVEKLENGELSLARSLESFEEGMKLAKTCEHQLNEASGRVEKIMKDFAGKEKIVLIDDKELDLQEDDSGDDDDI